MTTVSDLGSCRVGVAIKRPPASVSPDEAYDNHEAVSRLVREALHQGGLGKKEPQVPLADIISPGMHVLLKPNWVHHVNSTRRGMACMVTHPQFILAVLSEVLKAKPGRVIVGDAPIQGCDWNALIPTAFQEEAKALAASHDVALDFVDFRRVVVPTGDPADGILVRAERSEDRQVHFDLKSDSALEPVSTPPGRFRGVCYSPDTLATTHYPGTHQYLLCRETFETDVVLSLPKLKTHRRAGLTAALKNLVGLTGDKNYLPHHRVGGSATGGDCYPGRSVIKRLGEFCCDLSDRRIGSRLYTFWRYPYAVVRKLMTSDADGHLEAAWYGNDTTWRMVVDLNRILLYGRLNGTMADAPQRHLYSLTDGIVCGEADGPLRPEPLMVGAVTFSDCTPVADAAHAALLKMDYRRIPVIREAFGRFRWPLTTDDAPPVVCHEGRELSLQEVVQNLGVAASPPGGWRGHIEWTR